MTEAREYRPEDRPNRSVRFRNDTWDRADETAGALRLSRNRLIELATEAVAFGEIRCYRCGTAVPVRFGDLKGRPLLEVITAAEQSVVDMHPAHERLWIGRGKAPEAEAPALVGANGTSRSAAELRDDLQAQGHPVVVASELAPPAGTVVFREPGAEPVVEFPVPGDVPAAGRKKSRLAHAPNCTCAMCKPAGRKR